jgi:hypothetical protein
LTDIHPLAGTIVAVANSILSFLKDSGKDVTANGIIGKMDGEDKRKELHSKSMGTAKLGESFWGKYYVQVVATLPLFMCRNERVLHCLQ